MELDSCLMCTSQCQSQNGPVKRERIENEDFQFTTADQDDDHPKPVSDEEHLTPFFVLKNILKVPAETLEQLIYGEFNSQDPLSQGNGGAGGQVPLCPPCAELARQFHETFEEVSRLKMILSGIQAEFMDKLQRNKDDQCQGSSSIWKQLRPQVILHCFGDDAPPKTEESGEFEEEWHFVETVVKSEVADEHDEDSIQCFGDDLAPNTDGSQDFEEEGHFGEPTIKTEVADEPGDGNDDEGNLGVPAFALSSDSSSALRFDEGVNENLSPESRAPPPPKKRKASRPEVTPVLKNLRCGSEMLHPPPNTEKSCEFEEEWHFGEAEVKAEVLDQPDGVEFMDKMQRNKDDKCDGTSYLSKQLRRQVVLESFGDNDPPNTEGSQDFEEVWHFGETIVKEEVSDEPGDEDEGNFAVFPTSPYSSSALRFEARPISHLEDDEGSNENLLREPRAPPTTKQRKVARPEFIPILKNVRSGKNKWEQCTQCPFSTQKASLMDAHVSLHEEGSQAAECGDCGFYVAPEKLARHRAYFHSLPRGIQKTKKKTGQQQLAPELQCPFCPHKTTQIIVNKRHQKVHEAESEATACNGCGIFFSVRSFVFHQNSCARVIRNSLGRDELLSEVATKGKMLNINASNPGFISFERAMQKKKKHYQCRQCPYETLTLARVKVHVELHEEASQYVTCAECGWFLPPDQVETHRALNHSAQEFPSELPACVDLEEAPSHPIPQPSVKKIPTQIYRCAECPYQSTTKLVYEAHLALHSEDSKAIPCLDCDVFYRPSLLMKSHPYCGKFQKLKKLRRHLSANGNNRKPEENPSQPPNPE